MRAKVVAVPFRREGRSFDDRELVALLEQRRATGVREYFYVTHDGEPALSCFVTWDEEPEPRELAVEPAPKRAEARGKRSKRVREDADSGDLPPLDEAGRRAHEALRSWRSQRARDLGVPAYRVLTNRQLHALASGRPRSNEDLGRVQGIGPRTRETHGPAILERIGSAAAAVARSG